MSSIEVGDFIKQHGVIPEGQHRFLGASGIRVPPLGTGTNRWSRGRNDESVFKAFQALLDVGMNFFDTAEVYSFGKSESLIGRCLERDPRPVIIATKFAPYPNRLSRGSFNKALDASLNRLNMSKVEMYYLHFPSALPSIVTVMEWMAQAVSAGKIGTVGVSNCSAEQMRQAADHLRESGIPLAANEVHYNLFNRKPEVNGVLEACRELNVALMAYRPLEGGLLTAPSTNQKRKTTSREATILSTLQTIARQRGKSVGQVSLNWMLQRDEHIIPIPGTTNSRHALDNVETLTWQLSKDEFAAIDQASSPNQNTAG